MLFGNSYEEEGEPEHATGFSGNKNAIRHGRSKDKRTTPYKLKSAPVINYNSDSDATDYEVNLHNSYKMLENAEEALQDKAFVASQRGKKLNNVLRHDYKLHEYTPDQLPFFTTVRCETSYSKTIKEFIDQLKNEDESKCFACRHGIGLSSMEDSILVHIATIITETEVFKNKLARIDAIHDTFNTLINECYSLKRNVQEEKPVWSKAMIYAHITKHMSITKSRIQDAVDILQDEINVLYAGLYSVPVDEYKKTNGKPSVGNYIVNPQKHSMLIQSINAMCKLESLLPANNEAFNGFKSKAFGGSVVPKTSIRIEIGKGTQFSKK